MPVKRRIAKARDDYPQPWESRPICYERWLRHRERLLASTRSGRRPEEWWAYEAPFGYPGYDDETVALYQAGLLSEDELAKLMRWWREQFDAAQDDPDFTHVVGPGQFITGAAARRAHYRWAYIPPEILKAWTDERRRKIRSVRQLARSIV